MNVIGHKMAQKAIFVLYEVLLRRHSLDRRFQGENARTRIAGLFAVPILELSSSEMPRLMKLDPSDDVRCLWLLCFLHICQESPEQIIRDHFRHQLITRKDPELQSFTKLLKICTLSFQGFIGLSSSTLFGKIQDISWLVQEAYNTLCSILILLVDECADILLSDPDERKNMSRSVFDLLLFILTTPQSSITQTRALGGACLCIDRFGVSLFIEVVADNMQHWARVLFTLLNSVELSVRSVTIDFIISILSDVYDENGSIDEISVVMLSVLPEVIAREIALYVLRGQIKYFEDIEKCLWPMRRAFGEIEGTDPNDDDRIDAQLSPILSTFCQACQAIADGVLIELKLEGKTCSIAGVLVNNTAINQKTKVADKIISNFSFDADEESLFEAANVFSSETAPMQRLRWLFTLKGLHESKNQWVEAAETNLLCARTIANAIPLINSVWRPSHFSLWRDPKRSPWLYSITNSDKKNHQSIREMTRFSERFLESPTLLTTGHMNEHNMPQSTSNGKLQYPTISSFCNMLIKITDEAIVNYVNEGNHTDLLASARLEQLLRNLMDVVDRYCAGGAHLQPKNLTKVERKQFVKDNAALRRASTHINTLLAKLADRMVATSNDGVTNGRNNCQYVRLSLMGKKIDRFEEASTSIPAFLEWGCVYICRVSKSCLDYAEKKYDGKPDKICKAFADPIVQAISSQSSANVIFCTKAPSASRVKRDSTNTFIVVTKVNMVQNLSGSAGDVESKRFFSKVFDSSKKVSTVTESTVGQCFPCALSRQREIISTEYVSGKS